MDFFIQLLSADVSVLFHSVKDLTATESSESEREQTTEPNDLPEKFMLAIKPADSCMKHS